MQHKQSIVYKNLMYVWNKTQIMCKIWKKGNLHFMFINEWKLPIKPLPGQKIENWIDDHSPKDH